MSSTPESAVKTAAKRHAKRMSDSALSDAEEAREEERTEGHTWTAEERREHLLEEVQDAPEKARSEGRDPDVALAMIEQLQKTLALLEKRVVAAEAAPPKGSTQLLKCGTCRQAVKAGTRGVCDGNHVWVKIAPKQMDLWSAFQGVIINGEMYIGTCPLPVSMADNAVALVGRWAP